MNAPKRSSRLLDLNRQGYAVEHDEVFGHARRRPYWSMACDSFRRPFSRPPIGKAQEKQARPKVRRPTLLPGRRCREQ